MKDRLIVVQRFLAQNLFYPLVLSSVLACAMLAARAVRTERLTFRSLAWNLMLAWIPYVVSLWAALIQRRRPRAWWLLLIPGALWLLFFPNAPYIITDLLYLRERPPVPLWYDLGMLMAFAWSGCFLAIASLHIMQRLARNLLGVAASWLFVLATIGLSGLGVYLGRFQRWNSWDILFQPRAVLADALRPLLAPHDHVHVLAASGMFAALLLVIYLMFVAMFQGGRMGATPD